MPTRRLNHTMFRIRDPKVSLKFYTEILGMELLAEHPGGDFTNYFLAFPQEGVDYSKMSKEEKSKSKFGREGVLELCHNWGTESDPEFKGYANGNSDPGRGFGHICYTADSLEDEVARLIELGVPFKKRPEDGKMKNIAFILDPDGYWIELISHNIQL
ncbi:lactoylglutathione lyase [Microbotryum lychnidis-dioicae p1A1 Lamole]|uniref:lactoylglutathione lyase n=1 Tax=Microbotryum lychnidis-dioicae (strain p1A1 Lamole / MvSl-1064) TaxID=683840 RepID=U5H433_USTV1|nr:lactoylglutathione lyase [Microbotryum lychnidis-dioicae p1A1 Lamole]|eukprot:KDE07618.1 lactoylglutathione lyase [Microbotryum lychnidis-dioicae p1A1 Lamole]